MWSYFVEDFRKITLYLSEHKKLRYGQTKEKIFRLLISSCNCVNSIFSQGKSCDLSNSNITHTISSIDHGRAISYHGDNSRHSFSSASYRRFVTFFIKPKLRIEVIPIPSNVEKGNRKYFKFRVYNDGKANVYKFRMKFRVEGMSNEYSPFTFLKISKTPSSSISPLTGNDTIDIIEPKEYFTIELGHVSYDETAILIPLYTLVEEPILLSIGRIYKIAIIFYGENLPAKERRERFFELNLESWEKVAFKTID